MLAHTLAQLTLAWKPDVSSHMDRCCNRRSPVPEVCLESGWAATPAGSRGLCLSEGWGGGRGRREGRRRLDLEDRALSSGRETWGERGKPGGRGTGETMPGDESPGWGSLSGA